MDVRVDCSSVNLAVDEGMHYHEYVDGLVLVHFGGSTREYPLHFEMQNGQSDQWDRLLEDILSELDVDPEEKIGFDVTMFSEVYDTIRAAMESHEVVIISAERLRDSASGMSEKEFLEKYPDLQ